jgi:tRNA 2-thiouridine synthesizing protein D
MKYAIQINGGPGPNPPAEVAYQFIKAALKAGHEIVRVFFYRDGVLEAFPQTVGTPPDRPDWGALAHGSGIDLVLCVAALERRGLSGAEPRPGFRTGGLGLWMEACLLADRTLVFGG